MGPFEVAVVAIISGIIYAITKTYMTQKGAITAEQEIAQLRQELDRMNQRIQTLETIITDDGYNLKDEINRL
ncbi:hypothetical protein L9G74_17475 [Shewanella sp. C32]|uniref:Phage shock protein B n=1 Tax=Shewanella electrica TaxID=515560 RepID=A0ABT2FPU5_9GAMM|nr:hypothetical protein [Shewanella electrica]MCH1926612.1 hypothetical protein [Shewanella electrica]MCS4558233.1 hypothetical protein [Shewanella electrica]